MYRTTTDGYKDLKGAPCDLLERNTSIALKSICRISVRFLTSCDGNRDAF